MVAKLSVVETNAPGEFVKTLLKAAYAREDTSDAEDIERGYHEWVRENRELLDLRRASDYGDLVGAVLVPMAGRYRSLLDAAAQPQQGLEAVFYNEINGLSAQFLLLLTAADPTDSDEVFESKAGLVSRFLDLVLARRMANHKPVQPSELAAEVARLIPLVRAARDVDQLRRVLGAEVVALEDDFSGMKTLALRSDNRKQVRYLLARMTAWVERECGAPDRIAEYLGSGPAGDGRPYDVEHIWEDRFERYQAEALTFENFQTMRNRLGGLLLLERAVNASFGDDPYKVKIDYYQRQNHLARSLHPLAYQRDPRFRRFLDRQGLRDAFRPYGEVFGARALNERQVLYQLLCEQIWDAERLGFVLPQPAPVAPSAPRRRTRARYGVTLRALVEADVIAVGARLTARHMGKSYEAVVVVPGLIRLPSDESFDSPSRAAMVALGRQSWNGWTWWYVQTKHGRERLDRIRARALAQGLLEGRDAEA